MTHQTKQQHFSAIEIQIISMHSILNRWSRTKSGCHCWELLGLVYMSLWLLLNYRYWNACILCLQKYYSSSKDVYYCSPNDEVKVILLKSRSQCSSKSFQSLAFLCSLQSIAAHSNNFLHGLSTCSFIPLSVCLCLSSWQTFLVVTCCYVLQATHVFLECCHSG